MLEMGNIIGMTIVIQFATYDRQQIMLPGAVYQKAAQGDVKKAE